MRTILCRLVTQLQAAGICSIGAFKALGGSADSFRTRFEVIVGFTPTFQESLPPHHLRSVIGWVSTTVAVWSTIADDFATSASMTIVSEDAILPTQERELLLQAASKYSVMGCPPPFLMASDPFVIRWLREARSPSTHTLENIDRIKSVLDNRTKPLKLQLDDHNHLKVSATEDSEFKSFRWWICVQRYYLGQSFIGNRVRGWLSHGTAMKYLAHVQSLLFAQTGDRYAIQALEIGDRQLREIWYTSITQQGTTLEVAMLSSGVTGWDQAFRGAALMFQLQAAPGGTKSPKRFHDNDGGFTQKTKAPRYKAPTPNRPPRPKHPPNQQTPFQPAAPSGAGKDNRPPFPQPGKGQGNGRPRPPPYKQGKR